jgi:hypothetical protein
VGDIDCISLDYVGLQTTCLLVYNMFTPDACPKSRAKKSGRISRSFSTLAKAFNAHVTYSSHDITYNLPLVLRVLLTSQDLSHHSYSPFLRYNSHDGNAWNTSIQSLGALCPECSLSYISWIGQPASPVLWLTIISTVHRSESIDRQTLSVLFTMRFPFLCVLLASESCIVDENFTVAKSHKNEAF